MRADWATRILLFADSLLFSVANFLLTISVARIYSERQFAAMGVALAFVLAVQAVQKALYIVRVSLMPLEAARRRRGGILAEHLMVVAGAVCCAGAVAGIGTLAGAGEQFRLIGLAAVASYLIYFQADFDRAILLKLGSALRPALLSLSYVIATAVLGALAKWRGLSFPGFILGLVVFSVGKGCVVAALVGAWPRWRQGWRLLRLDWKRYGLPSVVGAANYAGFTHVPVMLLESMSGPLEVSVYVAMRTIMQPLMVVIRSLDAADKNRFHERSGATRGGVRRVFWRTMALYGGIGLAALAVLAAAPNELILIVYKGKYLGHPELLIGWCLFALMLALGMPIQSVIYLLHRQRQLIGWGMVSSLTGFGLALLACGPLGARGAMLSMLCGAAVGMLGQIWSIRDVVLRPLARGAQGESIDATARAARPAAEAPGGLGGERL
jgi:O-antigen/teichoic acid export membrane protein